MNIEMVTVSLKDKMRCGREIKGTDAEMHMNT